ncbi:MAG: glycoside hydrolase family 26 protein, partial [Thermodesulfobacteriota bacterium]
HMVKGREILQGEYDDYIQGFAAEVKRFRDPVLIRFAHEMNLKRYHWGSSQEEYGQQSPKLYQEIYRYVAGLFQDQGADNAKFVFCPNAESLPSPGRKPRAEWNQASNYYPGDEYVDVLGMDGYNWGQSRTLEEHGWQSSWQSFEQIFASIYEELKGLAADKPIFVFETAAAQQGGDRDKWVQEAFRTAAQWELQGIFWFQVDKENDWRLRLEPGSSYPSQVRKEHFSPVPCFRP